MVASLERQRTQVTHAEAGHHLPGHAGHLLNIATGTGGDFSVTKNDVLSSAAAESAHDSSPQLSAAHKHLLFIRSKPGQTLGLTTWNQGHLLHGIVILDQGSHQGMAHFVISDQTLAAAIGEGLPLHAGNHAINGIVDLGQGGGVLAATRRQDGRFVEQVGQISPCETGGAASNHLKTHVFRQFFVAGMHFQDGQAALDVRGIHRHLTVEAAGAH